MNEQQVLIAGGGPTGLSLALTLRRFGITPRIIDRSPTPAGVSKALAVWSGSLEALAGMGVIDDFVAAGQRLKALCVGDASKELARLAVGEGIDSPYPFPLLLPQSKTEQILATRLAAMGTQVERGVELVGFVQDNDHVTATLKHGDGRSEEVRASYLVGCDGARSLVRQTLGVDFEGYTEPQTFLLGDVLIDGGNLDHTCIYLWWHGGGTIALFPFGGNVWRIFAVRENDEGAEPPKLDELQAARRSARTARYAAARSDLALGVPHQRAVGGALSSRPLFPRRRRGAYPHARGRAGHEHGHAGRREPRLETRLCAQRSW